MGIYASGSIFGIRMFVFGDDEISKTVFELKSDRIMSAEEMKEAYLRYEAIPCKNTLHFQFYTECSSTLEARSSIDARNPDCMMWHPMSLNLFLEIFRFQRV